jgi:L-iditol 2-dehydrogenase
MKALVLHSNGALKLDERSRPIPTSGEPILLRVAYAGVCGSDIPRAFDGGAYHYPLVLGHEFSATVEEAPEGSAFGRGDRVTAFPLIPDLSLPINRSDRLPLQRPHQELLHRTPRTWRVLSRR